MVIVELSKTIIHYLQFLLALKIFLKAIGIMIFLIGPNHLNINNNNITCLTNSAPSSTVCIL